MQSETGAVKSVRPGIKAEEIETFVIDYMKEVGYEKYSLPHYGGVGDYFGHGIGLEQGDKPLLVRGDKTELRENMVLAIEPGVYMPGVGGVRIEDEVIVTEGGCETITRCKRVWW